MNSSILLLSLLALSSASPTSQKEKNELTQDELIELTNLLYNAAYKKNFKDILTEYVLSQYKDLTFEERDQVEAIIEDLLHNVATDFRIILNNEPCDTEDIANRITEPTFNKIYQYILVEAPSIDKKNALRLAYRLENHLVGARHKIDRVIKESEIASIQNT